MSQQIVCQYILIQGENTWECKNICFGQFNMCRSHIMTVGKDLPDLLDNVITDLFKDNTESDGTPHRVSVSKAVVNEQPKVRSQCSFINRKGDRCTTKCRNGDRCAKHKVKDLGPQEPVEEPVIEEPVKEPVVEEPVAEEPVEEPVVEEPVAEEPVDIPVVEEPVGEPVAEEPVGEPVAEEPVSEEPVVQKTKKQLKPKVEKIEKLQCTHVDKKGVRCGTKCRHGDRCGKHKIKTVVPPPEVDTSTVENPVEEPIEEPVAEEPVAEEPVVQKTKKQLKPKVEKIEKLQCTHVDKKGVRCGTKCRHGDRCGKHKIKTVVPPPEVDTTTVENPVEEPIMKKQLSDSIDSMNAETLVWDDFEDEMSRLEELESCII